MTTEAEALRTAIDLHQAGRLPQAEQIYRIILDRNPKQPDALHLLGVVALQSGRPQEAISYIGQAIAAAPGQPMYHNNLGKAYQMAGDAAQARASYERALTIDPSLVSAHFNLGTLCEAGAPAEAQRHYERAIELAPNNPLAHNNLGVVLRAQGKLQEGIAAFRRALDCDPQCAEARESLAQASAELERAAQFDGQSAEAQVNLGAAYRAAKAWDRAIECFREAVRMDPDSPEARCGLAGALKDKGETAAAEAELAESVRRHPGHYESLVDYGSLLASQGRAAEALELTERALAVKGDSALAHFQRARVLESLRRFGDAEQALREAIRHRPNYPEARAGLAVLGLRNVSHYYRAIFVHVPKNGGTSIKEVLGMPGGGHPTWQYYALRFPQLWEQYTKFAVVRNPWDRTVSAYHHAKMLRSHWHDERKGLHPDYKLLHDKSFEECLWILLNERGRLRHESWFDQSYYVVDAQSPDKRVMVDYLLRLESLDADFAELCRKLGVPCERLPTVNPSQRAKDYRAYYNDATRKLVEQIYRADIEKFGYTF
jgi:tetratricopeptide (TPR) repeat protein